MGLWGPKSRTVNAVTPGLRRTERRWTVLFVSASSMLFAAGAGLSYLTLSKALSLLIPMLLYIFYTTRVLSGLRVFKHVVRGLSYTNVGQYRLALLAYRRALQLESRCY